MGKDFNKYLPFIKESLEKQNIDIPVITENKLNSDLEFVSYISDIVLMTYLDYGLKEDFEPDQYGSKLDDTYSYLNRIIIKLNDNKKRATFEQDKQSIEKK